MLALAPVWLLFACGSGDADSGPLDRDGDGVSAETDCDDADPRIAPGFEEECDRLDNDCDALVDEADPDLVDGSTWFLDADGDGAGDGLSPVIVCARGDGYVASAGDCDDSDPTVSVSSEWYADEDGDGYGDAAASTVACGAPPEHVADATDCDDAEAGVNPGEPEVCGDGLDQDCDGTPNDCGASGDTPLVEDEWTLEGTGRFGAAIADLGTPGDVRTFAVASPSAEGGAGAVGLFTWDDGLVAGPVLTGALPYEGSGTALVARDVDDDGVRDLLVVDTSAAWLVHGPVDADGALAEAALRLDAVERDSVADGEVVGDHDGDGVRDLLITYTGAPDSVGFLASGAATGAVDSTTALATLTATRTFTGGRAAALGDLDGDGAEELGLVHANGTDTLSSQGLVYLLAGPLSGEVAVAEVETRLVGEQASGGPGMVVHDAGDVDGDGYADIFVGGPAFDAGASDTGAAWLVRGPVTASVDLADATWILRGDRSAQELGHTLAVLDFDGDTRADLVVGGAGGSTDRGEAVVCLSPSSGELLAADADVRLLGAADGHDAGAALLGGGDLDGDGDEDLLLGAPGAGGGTVYAIAGGLGI